MPERDRGVGSVTERDRYRPGPTNRRHGYLHGKVSMRIAIADDSGLFREGMVALLVALGIEVSGAVTNAGQLLALVDNEPPDAVILDIRMPPTFTTEGIQAAESLRARHPDLGILVLSTYAEPSYAEQLLRLGSNGVGYLLKDSVDDVATLLDALKRVATGGCVLDPTIVARLVAPRRGDDVLSGLTARERDVLRSMAEGRSNHGISQAFFLSPRTVEKHVASVFAKLGLPDEPDDNRRVLATLAWLAANHSDR